jgi:hypothetical protein
VPLPPHKRHYVFGGGFDGTIRVVDVTTKSANRWVGQYGVNVHSPGTGFAATLEYPRHIDFSADGLSMYVTTASYHIAKIIVATGVMTTWVGDGTGNSNEGTGVGATLAGPVGIRRYANDGNFYVAEKDSHRIRRISSAAVTSAFAGTVWTLGYVDGPGSSARFNLPLGVDIQQDVGQLYVADQNNHVIRYVTISTGDVGTLVGSGNSASSAADGYGPDAECAQPIAVTLHPLGRYLYVTCQVGSIIKKISLETQFMQTTFGGVISAAWTISTLYVPNGRANTPVGMCFKDENELYFTGSNAIGKITLVTDYTDDAPSTVREGSLDLRLGNYNTPGTADGIGSAAQLTGPRHVWHRYSEGYMYLGEMTTFRYFENTPGNAVQSMFLMGDFTDTAIPSGTVSVSAARFADTNCGCFLPGERIFIMADANRHVILSLRWDAVYFQDVTVLTGQVDVQGSVDGPAGTATFSKPGAVVYYPLGLVAYVFGGNTIRAVTRTGRATTCAGVYTLTGGPVFNGIGTAARIATVIYGAAIHFRSDYVLFSETATQRHSDL